MAEIITSSKKSGKYLHQSIRVDLTPMVDLGSPNNILYSYNNNAVQYSNEIDYS